jgi:hypothetical protein
LAIPVFIIIRLFTSLPFARFLLKNRITMVGTLNSNRRGIPQEMKTMKDRPDGDYKVMYEEDGKVSIHSWLVNNKKGTYMGIIC